MIAPLVQAKDADAPVRVWVPGCATGEEALFARHAAAGSSWQRREERARCKSSPPTSMKTPWRSPARASIPRASRADVSPERLARFFTRIDESAYQVNKQLREAVVFAAQNLIADAPFSKLDLDQLPQSADLSGAGRAEEVIALFHFALNEGGYLFLGPSETIGRHIDLFEPVSKKWRIFRRIGPTGRTGSSSRSSRDAEPASVRRGERRKCAGSGRSASAN